MASNREEKGYFNTDPQQRRAQQQVYDQLHSLRYYDVDSDEEEVCNTRG